MFPRRRMVYIRTTQIPITYSAYTVSLIPRYSTVTQNVHIALMKAFRNDKNFACAPNTSYDKISSLCRLKL